MTAIFERGNELWVESNEYRDCASQRTVTTEGRVSRHGMVVCRAEYGLDVLGNVGSVLRKCKMLRIQTACAHTADCSTVCSPVFVICTSTILRSARTIVVCFMWI